MVKVLFDVSRLYMRAAGTSPTGIDRVNEAYGRWLLSRADLEVIPVCTWGGIVVTLELHGMRSILARPRRRARRPGETWEKLLAALAGPAGARPVLRATSSGGGAGAMVRSLVDKGARYAQAGGRALAHSRPRRYAPGDIYLNVSHYGLEQPGLLRRLTRRGVRPMAMIHDLIPIEHPEYCSPASSVWHRRRIETLLEHGTLLITNSGTTAADVGAYAADRGLAMPPVCVAPLGLEPDFLKSGAPTPVAGTYFVCVGTIEPRKNLTFLLTLWRHLADRMGEATPPLVLVGQRGWENESVIDHLDRSPPIRRFVHEVNDLSNDELARLIAGARALLSPSFSEGFNLPVAEALAMGAPVIASDIAVHRELAAGARLIDPLDGPAWLAAIESAAARRGPRPPFRALSWDEHFALVARAMGLNPV